MSQTIALYDEEARAPLFGSAYQPPATAKRSLFSRIFNAKTQDVLIGAAVTGSLSYATRIGVLTAATTAGAAALPAALAAGAVTGFVVGSYRFYREAKKEGYDFNDAVTRKKFYKQLLVSTALSTVGGGLGYSFVHHYDQIAGLVRDTGVPAWIGRGITALGNTSFGVAVADMAAPVGKTLSAFAASAKTTIADTYNAMPSFASIVDGAKSYASSAKAAIVDTYNSIPNASSIGESLKETGKGWWSWARNAVGLSADTQIASAPDTNVTVIEKTVPGVQKADMLAQEKGWTPEKNVTVIEKTTDLAAASEVKTIDGMPVRVVKTLTVLPDGTMTAYVPEVKLPEVPALAPLTSEQILAQQGKIPDYVQEIFSQPKGTLEITPKQPAFMLPFIVTEAGIVPQFDEASLPKFIPDLANNFTTYSDILPSGVSQEFTAAIQPDGSALVTSVGASVPMKDQLSTYFEGKDLSGRAQRAVDAAMKGDLQAQKDLAMKILHGKGGFDKDPAMALKLYDNVIAEGTVEGKRPRGAVFQAMQDKAWVLFHGKGVPADPTAAKAIMGELAEFNSGARATLREWSGEKIQKAASVAKTTVKAATEQVRDGAAKLTSAFGDNVKCESITVKGSSKEILSCTANADSFAGKIKVGDTLSYNP